MEILGVIGNPIDHSLSPEMHNSAFRAVGKRAMYVPLHVQESNIGAALLGAKALGFRGLNVTIPYKETIIPFLDDLTMEAREIGTVNTILFRENKMIGHTTDGPGFVEALQEGLDLKPTGTRFLIIGAGGSARAIVNQLLKDQCHVIIANRSDKRAQKLVADLNRYAKGTIRVLESLGSLHTVVDECDVIVNTTSVGMKATRNLTPFPIEQLCDHHKVVDIIYSPQRTVLLQAAEAKGLPNINGVGMLVGQAAKAWEFWWGESPPVEVMYNAVKCSLDQAE